MTKGVYTIILQIHRPVSIEIGSIGRYNLERGFYAYTGSAFGSGGLESRIARHLRREKKIFWHIDYLTSNFNISIAAFIKAEEKRKIECEVNRGIFEKLDSEPIVKVGSSDCKEGCKAHLIRIKDLDFSLCLRGVIEVYLESTRKPIVVNVN